MLYSEMMHYFGSVKEPCSDAQSYSHSLFHNTNILDTLKNYYFLTLVPTVKYFEEEGSVYKNLIMLANCFEYKF